MRTTTVMVIGLALSLCVTPAFASNDGSMNFHALDALASNGQALTPLDDKQLSSIEGTNHNQILINVLVAAQALANANPLVFGQIGQLAHVISNFALLNALVTPRHACGGAFGPC